ncbi:hypothetical protein SO486_05330 [Pseudomonas salmasensis]|uniref:Uncharacterized protein n=1 Tax=Pseudomonas salmasensis TaxID=2745514 RepID=A0ABU5FB70_9PSED|nr:hypothetical protein [Pseudomonas salmasensis]MDY4299416.1 hypothetical protein [Pseudomonas salmasensis]
MATRENMKKWVVEALTSVGGTAWPKDVAKYVWDNYEIEIRGSGSLLYTWQYDARWAATAMRKAGVLKAVHGRTDLSWELV